MSLLFDVKFRHKKMIKAFWQRICFGAEMLFRIIEKKFWTYYWNKIHIILDGFSNQFELCRLERVLEKMV